MNKLQWKWQICSGDYKPAPKNHQIFPNSTDGTRKIDQNRDDTTANSDTLKQVKINQQNHQIKQFHIHNKEFLEHLAEEKPSLCFPKSPQQGEKDANPQQLCKS